MRLLMAAPRPALLAMGAALQGVLQSRYLSLPQNGLALMPLRDGAFNLSLIHISEPTRPY